MNMVSTNCNVYSNEQVPQNAPTMSVPVNGHQPPVVYLLDKEQLWSKYFGMPNEMMVINTGRELFPKLKYGVKGLNPNAVYTISIVLQRKSDNIMKYEEGEWKESSKPVDGPEYTNCFTLGSMRGHQWMNAGIDAEDLKIYNAANPKKVGGKPVDPNDRLAAARAAAKAQKLRETQAKSIEVKTLTKYLPVVTIWEWFPDGTGRTVQSFSAPETQFLTCTGYKNPTICDMKSIDNKYVTKKVKNTKAGVPRVPDAPSPVSTAAPFQMDGQGTSDVVRWDPDSPTNSSGYSSDRTSYSPEFVNAPSTQHYVPTPAPHHYVPTPAPHHYVPTPAPYHYDPTPAPHHYVPTPAPHHYVPTPTPYHPIPYPPAQPDLNYSHVQFEHSPEDHMLFHY
ncbi:unnamed protein product [Caenorhabditis sp. 36 PRJEB53466]|nr:unnamed protein product [Caenorhabditis sp. 36 PRJEB53466]